MPRHAGERLSVAPRICILGGGFGGLYTAVRLESLLWPQGSKPQVTLIDQSERFVFKPLLYELLNGGASPEEVAPFFTKLLAPYSTNFIQVRLPRFAAKSGTSYRQTRHDVLMLLSACQCWLMRVCLIVLYVRRAAYRP